jgi:radical SAM superfamily enzyme with C-terminal helix-hairpin-helix motif
MNQTPILSVALICVVMGIAASAQTRWVHINHSRAGNIIIAPVDLNTGSKVDLMRLPGITESDAQNIIDGRPFRTKSELLDKKILPAQAYAKISWRVSVSDDASMPR